MTGILAWIFRAILFLFVFRLATIVVRSFMSGLVRGTRPEAPRGPVSQEPRGQVEELVRDPICGVHTARSSALSGQYQGASAYFCSEECRAKAAS